MRWARLPRLSPRDGLAAAAFSGGTHPPLLEGCAGRVRLVALAVVCARALSIGCSLMCRAVLAWRSDSQATTGSCTGARLACRRRLSVMGRTAGCCCCCCCCSTCWLLRAGAAGAKVCCPAARRGRTCFAALDLSSFITGAC
jgi:hypothetical protein